ncbi:MAG: DNA adenine methylase [Sphingomonas sp.]|nr:DNA adenine methylase [Sphingomonas sp.]
MSSLTAVRPVRPVAGYVGGKKNLAGTIVPIIDAIDHRRYAEPFVGMGGIFLRRRRRPSAEFINDISGDVVTLFRVLQEHYPYFIDHLRFRLASRAEYERLLALPADRLTDINRAARFLYLQRLAFGGKVSGRNFGVDARQGARFNVTKLEPMLAELHERLAGVVVERLPFAEFIARYDTPETLFYCDPPYWGSETDYGAGVFERADFERLAGQLTRIKGRAIVSLNDVPAVREVFAGFHLREVETTYTIAGNDNGKRAAELLISTFKLP